ncbi:MAG TPA: ABC transporter substrate-binding protein [Acidimicrobiales bacterium]
MQLTGVRAAGAALAVAALLAAGCGGDDDTSSDDEVSADEAAEVLGSENPAEGEPVKVGLISDGPNQATDMQIELDVADATVEYLNRHRGGIGGRPIDLVPCSTEADPGVATDCANRMVEEDVVAVVIGSSAVMDTVWEPLHQAGLPTVLYASSSAQIIQDTESSFVMSNSTAGIIDLPIATAQEEGADKVTVVVIDVPAALSIYDGIGAEAYEEAGLELDVVTVPPGTADMSPQMQDIVSGDPGVIQVVGNDSFCISAFQGLQAAGYDGPLTTIGQCITDATLEAVPGEFLEGTLMSATAPVGIDSPDVDLYEAVIEAYGSDIDPSRITGWNMFIPLAGFGVAVADMEGEVTPETIVEALRTMPEMELPGSGGLTFQCDGNAVPGQPAICTRGLLGAVLNADGEPAEYEIIGLD